MQSHAGACGPNKDPDGAARRTPLNAPIAQLARALPCSSRPQQQRRRPQRAVQLRSVDQQQAAAAAAPAPAPAAAAAAADSSDELLKQLEALRAENERLRQELLAMQVCCARCAD